MVILAPRNAITAQPRLRIKLNCVSLDQLAQKHTQHEKKRQQDKKCTRLQLNTFAFLPFSHQRGALAISHATLLLIAHIQRNAKLVKYANEIKSFSRKCNAIFPVIILSRGGSGYRVFSSQSQFFVAALSWKFVGCGERVNVIRIHYMQ